MRNNGSPDQASSCDVFEVKCKHFHRRGISTRDFNSGSTPEVLLREIH